MTVSSYQVTDDQLKELFARNSVTIAESSLPDLHVLLEGRHSNHQFRSASQVNNRTKNCPDSNWLPHTMDEWLRYGIARYLRRENIEVCHPQLPSEATDEEINWDAMPDGYHVPGSCMHDECLLHELCGGPTHDGQLEQHQISPSSMPSVSSDGDILIHGSWRLRLTELRPAYVALVVESIAGLDMADPLHIEIGDDLLSLDLTNTYVINPLYTPEEVNRATQQPDSIEGRMVAKAEFWRGNVRDRLTLALSERLDKEREAATTGGEINVE